MIFIIESSKFVCTGFLRGRFFKGIKMKKLIIWDFDGVIADTEKLWITSRMNLLNRDLKLGWDFETAAKYIGGRSDKDKKLTLESIGIFAKESLWEEATKIDMERLNQGIDLTEGIEDIFKMTEFAQCIATGGIWEKTKVKIEKTGADKYFSRETVFTADLVDKGKPEPDLFLLAAKTMGYEPKDCIVIEDSIVGLIAAAKAGMSRIAFVKYDSEKCIEEIKKLGVKNMFDDMRLVKRFLIEKFLK